MISKTVETYGRLDCAHNHAGILTGPPAPTAEYPENGWHHLLAIHLTGVWLCMNYELRQMLQQGGGAMVNNASTAGLVGSKGFRAYREQTRRGGTHQSSGVRICVAGDPGQLRLS
jgi:NAD(P)-dependent dehydrogenase (short-subunit alcohol dehydrogenase family)